jgi:hypothetical protein
MQLIECGKGVFRFYIWMQESNDVFVFSDLINAENKSANKSTLTSLVKNLKKKTSFVKIK